MMSSPKLARVVPALLVVALFSSGCGVSKSKYLSATTSVESLTAQNAELKKNLDAATAKTAEMEKQVATTQAQVDQLNQELEKQKQAVAEVQSSYEGMVSKLQEDVNSGHVQIQRMRDGIRVNLAQDILFKSGSATLDPAGKELLDRVANELKSQNYEVVVIGHTDNQKIGPKLAQKFPSNWALGAARAGTIVRLFEEDGVAPARLLGVSAGENRPRADNATPEGREKNRRIEVLLRPVEVEPQAAQ